LRSWPGKFALACVTISLLIAQTAAAQAAPGLTPVLAVLDSGDLAQWQAGTQALGWRLLAPSVAAGADADARVQALEKQVTEAIRNGSADAARVYLGGRGDTSAAVFYAISRVPDLWAAAVALGGSPQAAIDSDRLYAANFTHVPVLWIGPGGNDQALAEQLQSAGIPLEWRSSADANIGAVLDWLGKHTREPYPAAIDCETNSPTFANCYWIRMMKFDAAERNDVLPSTRVAASPRASLDLGEFGFKPDSPGPGVLIGFLSQKYNGPLKMGDRIVELDGRAIPDARRYVELMSKISEERPAAVVIQHGKERIRLESRIVLPRRAPAATARVQAQYLAAEKQIQIVSRAVTAMRVTIPPQWVPSVLNWNGVNLEPIEAAGCRLLTIEREIEEAGACP